MICPRDSGPDRPEAEMDKMMVKLVDDFHEPFMSANGKSNPEELTNDEKCALCFFAEVPFRIDPETNRLEFLKKVRFERNEAKNKWMVYIKEKE